VTDSHARLDARLSDVERALYRIEGRLRVLEAGAALPPNTASSAVRPALPPRRAGAGDAEGTLTLLGQMLVIFAGAYLLRALTESAMLGRGVGIALGLTYAVAWTGAADRNAVQAPLRATVLGACTVLMGLPLLWEATLRFAWLPPAVSAFGIAALTGIVLVTAWRRHLHVLAWIATAGALVAGAALLVMTGSAAAFSAFFVALGTATLWLGYDREWVLLRWPTALVADAAVLGLTMRALTTPPRDVPAVVMSMQLLLITAYLGSIAVRTLARGRNALPFEVVQTAAALMVGLGGALAIVHRTGSGTAVALGCALVAMAVLSYAVAFAFVDRRQGGGANLYFYTSLALVFALTGSRMLLPVPIYAVCCALLAVLASIAARRYDRTTLAIHAVVYAAAAASTSGVIAASLAALTRSHLTPWPAMGAAGWFVLLATVLCFAILGSVRREAQSFAPSIPARTFVALSAFGVAGALAIVLVPLLLPYVPPDSARGAIATLRTAILAIAVLAIAWLGRREATRDAGYLLYPVLVWGALKLAVEDFSASPPSLLFVALASYGGALILAPRIARRRRDTPVEDAAV
jgi:hypothetical protein